MSRFGKAVGDVLTAENGGRFCFLFAFGSRDLTVTIDSCTGRLLFGKRCSSGFKVANVFFLLF
jgi:hypothetical protein